MEDSQLIKNAHQVYRENFNGEVFFERSIFTNWTCAIADCKYCYLSTKPKHNPREEIKSLRSHESILAEVLLCKLMGWNIGYITGGLRVESTEQLIVLLNKIEKVYGRKILMNYGPYSLPIVQKLKPHLTGMGSAIESFDEELHNYICPSKPLKSLLAFLENLKSENMEKLITLILGLGEKKEDIDLVIE
ncbi:radical SAM protein, partial [Candidatus Woesearchaeota archaeon]|nr:radical SAM protein [Candidatus Woesearchaeota archaeon]